MLVACPKRFFLSVVLSDQQSKNLQHSIYNDTEKKSKISYLRGFKVTILKMFIMSTCNSVCLITNEVENKV